MSGILSFPKGVSEMVPRQIGRRRGDSRENGVSAMPRRQHLILYVVHLHAMCRPSYSQELEQQRAGESPEEPIQTCGRRRQPELRFVSMNRKPCTVYASAT